jgi:threonine synthase
VAASDEEILAAQKALAREGIWVEPASAAGLAGLAAEIQAGRLKPKGQRIAVVCTGHGLKDPQIISDSMPAPFVIEASYPSLEEVILSE